MIETWIDAMCVVWEDITDERFGNVTSYKLIAESNFPDSIDPVDLDLHPIALTVPANMEAEYSMSGPLLGFYTGVTEFHVCPDMNRSRIPALLPWYGKIIRAAAGNMTLGGLVEHFVIDADGVTGPQALQYGNEAPHWGFVVQWKVKERITLTVSA